MIEIIQFPKTCCGVPLRWKERHGITQTQCRVTGKADCPNAAPPFLPEIKLLARGPEGCSIIITNEA